MNLRDLKIFATCDMANRLTECGIDVDQIKQIKIYDRQIPSNDNDDNLVWILSPLVSEFDYETVCNMLQRWIDTQIVTCYMNNTDRDLSIEIMGNGKGMMAI